MADGSSCLSITDSGAQLSLLTAAAVLLRSFGCSSLTRALSKIEEGFSSAMPVRPPTLASSSLIARLSKPGFTSFNLGGTDVAAGDMLGGGPQSDGGSTWQ